MSSRVVDVCAAGCIYSTPSVQVSVATGCAGNPEEDARAQSGLDFGTDGVDNGAVGLSATPLSRRAVSQGGRSGCDGLSRETCDLEQDLFNNRAAEGVLFNQVALLTDVLYRSVWIMHERPRRLAHDRG